MDPKSPQNDSQQNPQEQQYYTGGNPPYKAEKKMPSTTTKVVVLVVLIVLLIAGILLPIKLVPNAVSNLASSISSIFVPNSKGTLSTDVQNITSGQSFTLSWTGNHRTDGSYALSYQCTDGVSLETSVNQNNETIACGNPYYFSSTTNSIVLTPRVNGTAPVTIPVTITFLPNNSSTADTVGDLSIAVNASGSTVATNASSTSNQGSSSNVSVSQDNQQSSTTTQSDNSGSNDNSNPTPVHHTYVSNPNGTPDLALRILGTGFLDKVTHEFIPSREVSGDEQAAIKFEVINIGDKASGQWSFNADLPTQSNSHFDSEVQRSLNPGDRIIYTMGIEGLNNVEANYAYIHVDPSHSAKDADRSNNDATVELINDSANGTTVSKPDLSVSIGATGIMSNGTFVQTQTIGSNDTAAVKFTIVNNGTKPTGTWNFSATLPTYGQNTVYTSDPEASLAPGQTATFTIKFDNIAPGTSTFTVTIDPSNQIDEASKTNNSASVTLYRN